MPDVGQLLQKTHYSLNVGVISTVIIIYFWHASTRESKQLTPSTIQIYTFVLQML